MENSEYCWPQALWIKPPRVVFFEASCRKHDEYYSEGGNELHRLIADLFFYTYMLNDINKFVDKWYLKVFYVIWSTLYLIFVRVFWWLFFKYN